MGTYHPNIMLYFITTFYYPIHVESLNYLKLVRLSTSNLAEYYALKINLKEKWFMPNLKDDPIDVLNDEPLVLQKNSKSFVSPSSNIQIVVWLHNNIMFQMYK